MPRGALNKQGMKDYRAVLVTARMNFHNMCTFLTSHADYNAGSLRKAREAFRNGFEPLEMDVDVENQRVFRRFPFKSTLIEGFSTILELRLGRGLGPPHH